MRFPGVLFPKLGGSCPAGLDKSYSDNCPHEASGTPPLHYEGWRVDRASQGEGEERVRSSTWLWGRGGAWAGCLPSTLPSLSSSLGASARPGHRLWVYFLLGSAVPREGRG